MGKVWDWNMYGAKLKKFGGWVLHTANEDGERGEDDATAPPEDSEDGPLDGCSGPENGNSDLENHDSGLDDSGKELQDSNDESHHGGALHTDNEDGERGEDDATAPPEDSGDGPEDGNTGPAGCSAPNVEPCKRILIGHRVVQVLGICANFPICEIIGYDCEQARRLYVKRKGEVQEEGMVELVATGPSKVFMAFGAFSVKVYDDFEFGPPVISEGWDLIYFDEIEECTQTVFAGPSRKFEITYLVIPTAVEAYVEVKLKLKDLGSRSRAVYGKIKASNPEYMDRSVHLFSCGRGMSLPFPSGSASALQLSPCMVAVPYDGLEEDMELELHIEMDLTVITACDGQEEQDKNLKFSLEFTGEIMNQKREVDGDQVEVNGRVVPNLVKLGTTIRPGSSE